MRRPASAGYRRVPNPRGGLSESKGRLAMKDATTPNGEGKLTGGLDLGDKRQQLCMIAADGELLEEARLRTTPAALRRRFAALPGPVSSSKPAPIHPGSCLL